MNLRRGLLRLGITLAALWYVFWTFANVLVIHRSENEPIAGTPFTLTTDVALLITALVGLVWIVAGLWPNRRSPVLGRWKPSLCGE